MLKKQATIETFNKWSENYNSDGWSWYFSRCYSELIQYLRIKNLLPLKILDIGCGDGTLLLSLRKIFPNAVIDGTDITPAMLKLAKVKTKGLNINLFHGEVSEVPTTDYDLVVCMNTLHHVEDMKTFLENIKLRMSSNGTLIVVDPFRDNILRLAWEYISKHLFFHEPYIKYLTTKQLVNIFSPFFSLSDKKSFLYFILMTTWTLKK